MMIWPLFCLFFFSKKSTTFFGRKNRNIPHWGTLTLPVAAAWRQYGPEHMRRETDPSEPGQVSTGRAIFSPPLHWLTCVSPPEWTLCARRNSQSFLGFVSGLSMAQEAGSASLTRAGPTRTGVFDPKDEDAGPALFWACDVASPTLFPQCLWSRKTVARPSFSITANLQVVPKHLRTCCQAFNFQLMKCCPCSRKKQHIVD